VVELTGKISNMEEQGFPALVELTGE